MVTVAEQLRVIADIGGHFIREQPLRMFIQPLYRIHAQADQLFMHIKKADAIAIVQRHLCGDINKVFAHFANVTQHFT